MKRLILTLSVAFLGLSAFAQNVAESEKYEQRYDLLVSKMGLAGIGVETVLNNWEKVDSTNSKMLLGKFSYLFTKAQTAQVVAKPSKKYLGMEPFISLKDSLGNDVHYFQENVFDDELYGQAMKAADKAVALHPDRLDFRFLKANAYIAYEKDSPDMALAYLLALAKENAAGGISWKYEGADVDSDFFAEAMQEYCYSFYSIGSPASYEAFKTLSEQLLKMYPDNMGFMSNVGSYYLVNQEYKTALKYYDKVLKKIPDDYTAMQNGLLAARKMKNVKLERKYLDIILKYGSEKDKLVAKGRLEALDRK